MEQLVADALWQQRFNLQLIELFAGLALTLAAVGLKECCHIRYCWQTQRSYFPPRRGDGN